VENDRHLITPQDSGTLLRYGYGLTTLVERATAGEDGLDPAEYRAAAPGFREKIRHYAPAFIGFLGKAAYAGLVDQRDVAWGLQDIMIEGSKAWLLPNPSGRNRSFSLERLVAAYRDLKVAAAEAEEAKRQAV
jgi:TDG/mug DNA glycosylase family protein